MALLGAAPAQAALTLTLVGSFSQPIFAVAPPGDAHRLMVVERTGTIKVVKDGMQLAAPFLTVPDVDDAGEGGLLSWPSRPTTPPAAASTCI